MSEYVIMPKADYVAACDAIRAKTGKTDLIKSGDMEPEILGITTGGGSSADVRYVTFMNDDGTMQLGKKAVAVGDDCADPIARGIFGTPTKESTVQYTYTFSGGWATTPGGGKDSNALKAVTEDRTVYANFISAVRYYTITFYDSDGTTVLKTSSLAYGATPSYTPTKDNYAFGGWIPALATVTGDASYTAQWVEKVDFAHASWDKIAEICESGNAATMFSVGETRTIPLKLYGSNEGIKNVVIEIIGINHDDLADGSGKAGITIGTKNAIPNYAASQANGTMTKGWVNYVHRTNLNTVTFNNLPEGMRKHIKTVKKLSNTTYNNWTPVETEDKLFIPSITEFTGESYQNYSYGKQYAGYNTVAKRKKYYQDDTTDQSSSYAGHDTRNNSAKGMYNILAIDEDGKTYANSAYSRSCVCWCI